MIFTPMLIAVLIVGFSFGMHEMSSSMPFWAIAPVAFGLASVLVASVRSRQYRHIAILVAVSGILITNTGLIVWGNPTLSRDLSSNSSRSALDGLFQMLPWILIGVIFIAGVVACIWIYDDVKLRQRT
ncbi:hypothetical protein [Janthinobacterium sp. FW305-128]|uniref:hypothetical protein n=1 Tax=Janthinobacterium sp. FW305-128 TaxID=2775055 RepID=UPI001E62D410|nr:hypothetical protein [Janthinobacterium sp. FW305-128]MCC7684783.1 hypothetical protein [Janthinobacterium sp. FW305-128]